MNEDGPGWMRNEIKEASIRWTNQEHKKEKARGATQSIKLVRVHGLKWDSCTFPGNLESLCLSLWMRCKRKSLRKRKQKTYEKSSLVFTFWKIFFGLIWKERYFRRLWLFSHWQFFLCIQSKPRASVFVSHESHFSYVSLTILEKINGILYYLVYFIRFQSSFVACVDQTDNN